MKRYSQNDEQDVILNFFADRKTGTFLSIGENDGETLSNVRALALQGWKGVCVEPDPEAYARLTELYKDNPNVLCVPVAIADVDGPVTLHKSGEHLKTGDTGLLSSLDPNQSKKWKNETFAPWVVEGQTFASFYEEHCYPFIGVPDFVSIDAEGMDYKICDAMLGYCKPDLACVEYNSDNRLMLKFDRLFRYYSRIHHNYENLIYALR